MPINRPTPDFEATRPAIPSSTMGVDDDAVHDRSIGDLLRVANNLNEAQVQEILRYQQNHGVRFGEAAVALDLATDDEVLWAVSQQYHYPYSPFPQGVSPELIVAANPFSHEAELFRELRSQLMLGVMASNQTRRAVAFVSPAAGDGKTFISANLAVTFSQLGARTLVIDANLRAPRMHRIFGSTPKGGGLSGILSGRSRPDVIAPAEDLPSLYFLPAGDRPPNPLELLQRPRFSLLIRDVLAKFDYVFVDTPAASQGADARVIANACGAAVAVARQGQSRLDEMNAMVNSLTKARIGVAGVVLNDH